MKTHIPATKDYEIERLLVRQRLIQELLRNGFTLEQIRKVIL